MPWSVRRRRVPRARRARVDSAVQDAQREIRAQFDLDGVVRAVVESAHRSLECRRTSAWLTTGADPARLASHVGEGLASSDAPGPVAVAARSGRSVLNEVSGAFAVPLTAPRSGRVGVLLLERAEWTTDDRRVAERIAADAGAALEAASLYEGAVAEKEKSDAILARIGDGVIVTDQRGVIRQWNAAAGRIFAGASPAAVGSTCDAVLGLHDGERRLDCSAGCPLTAMSGGSSRGLGVEVWREAVDGRRQPLLATAESLRDPDGSLGEVVHSFRDVTRLKEADEAKTLFLATASHELKTPLTVIRGFAETLLTQGVGGLDPALTTQALEAISRRAVELDHIVDRLLLSSRIEAGRMQLTLREVDLAPILTERVESLSAASKRAISFEAAEDVPLVLADASAVTVVIDHLLNNAAKYSPGGEPILVRLEAHPAVTVTVRDGGIGMDAEQVARCFEKFWQAESSNARRFGGTGIGLHIVRSLVEAMSGSVSVDSVVGAGSTFHFRLAPANAGDDAAGTRPPVEAKELDPGQGERTVIREFMRQIGVPVRRQG